MKLFRTLVVGLAFVAAVANGQSVKKIQEVIANGATDATGGTVRLRGTIGQSVIGPTLSAQAVDQQGFWHSPGPGALGAVEITHTGLPGNFQLFQNYPNPFNPTTTIKFSLPTHEHVTLQVVSMTGALVKTLVDENYAAGEYSVVFSANDIPTGTYLYTLQAGGHEMTKRMILIK